MIRTRRCICSCLFVCLWITIGGQATMAQGTRQLEERIRVLEQRVDRLTGLRLFEGGYDVANALHPPADGDNAPDH